MTGNPQLHEPSTRRLVEALAASVGDLAVGSNETAYFIGTATGTTTPDNFTLPLEVMAGTPVRSWAPLEDGKVRLGPEAGGCVITVIGRVSADFITTVPTPDYNAYCSININEDGTGGSIASGGAPNITGDGETTHFDFGETTRDGAFIVGGLLAASGGATAQHGSDFIADGVATATIVVCLTRIAPAPVLPD